jgi:FtsP/CotA-like multicopper oxidase with cupredoxin domain
MPYAGRGLSVGRNMRSAVPTLNRRRLLQAGLAAASLPLLPPGARADAAPLREIALVAGPAQATLLGDGAATPVWAYGGHAPGPEIRVAQGTRLRVTLTNKLDRPTSLHFHGLCLANALDGVVGLTQKPIMPGDSFTYDFVARASGTYWYRPEAGDAEQQARGLAGALIVEDKAPVTVDRDLVWLLQDWRLDDEGVQIADFDRETDRRGRGRLGNLTTINGRRLDSVAVRDGERVRLRLINAAPARFYALKFEGHSVAVVAYDGQAVRPHYASGGVVVLAPGQRVDTIIDMDGGAGQKYVLFDDQGPRGAYRLLDLVYDGTPLRQKLLKDPLRLEANRLPEPDLRAAERHEIVVERSRAPGALWTFNGRVDARPEDPPLLALRRGASHVVSLRNLTDYDQPLHLHGHVFRTIKRNDEPTAYREWRDTVLVHAHETAEIALVADNRGNWLLQSQILAHRVSGLAGIARVS